MARQFGIDMLVEDPHDAVFTNRMIAPALAVLSKEIGWEFRFREHDVHGKQAIRIDVIEIDGQ